MGLCWYVIVTVLAVKVAVQPWSQSWPIEMSEPDASVGKMCAWQAALGRKGRSMVAVWVEEMESPLGRRTEMGESAFLMLVHGALVVMKCPVQPVSAIMDEYWIV